MIPIRHHHQVILEIISLFNSQYLLENNILFGGGTRIALELGEYRESIDIDFLCATPNSYKAVRSQINNESLGNLLTNVESISFPRGIRADRDAVRTFVQYKNHTIKLEFVHFDYYDLHPDIQSALFPVACIDKESCFLTKLLANADRYAEPHQKDISDLCMMHHTWGDITDSVWKKADEKYGLKSVFNGLDYALNDIINNPSKYLITATNKLLIKETLAKKIINDYAPKFLISIHTRKNFFQG